ncbi:unnamed protein product [Mytilus edulis]|uniref:Endonuclease/exonuclease/phosphatase domain-containing protein n=1 Tax=Mytilus edulis TaxID=6550 RepID=A0A8S3UWE6_MYTED|nr:unnamed protein product [Mytilus edulis]
MGDLNAHINCKELDFITNEVDDSLDNFLPTNYVADSVCKFRNTQVHQKTNNYGKLILDLCTESQLRILNGRTLGDSKGQFEPTISDHCPISITIHSQLVNKPCDNYVKPTLRRVKWTTKREEIFKSNMLKVNFGTINSDVDNLTQKIEANNTCNSNVTQSVNDTVSSISSILYNAAFLSNTNKTPGKTKRSKRRKIKKPYYDNECESKYRSLKSLTRKLCTEPWNDSLRHKVLYNKKELNKLIRKKYRQFRHKMIKQIIDSNNSCPNDFWNTVKKLKKENFKDPSSNIQPKEWFKYFNKLMNTDYDKNVCNDKKEYTTFKDCNTCTKMLNSFITTEEVDFDQDLKSVEDKLNDISKSVKHTGERDISYNLVIRNLPESANENLNSKISALMREGLKIQTISFSNVERKRSRNEHKSGVVIITCKSKDDLNQIMSSKCNLKFSRQYSDVYIHKDQSVQQRIERKNFQTIVDVLKSFDSEIDMRGAEIIAKRYVNHQQSRREGHFNRDMQSSRNEQSNSRHHRAGNRSQRDMHNNTHTGRRNDYNSDTRREQRDRNGEQQRHTTQGRW